LESAEDTYRKTPEDRSPNPAEFSAKSNGLEHIDARPDATIDVYAYPPGGSLHALRESIDSRWHAIQLTSTMIRDKDPITTHLYCLQRVFRGNNAFDPDLHRRDTPQPRDIASPVVRIVIEVHETIIVRLATDAFAIPA
jgi:hypothetical protein